MGLTGGALPFTQKERARGLGGRGPAAGRAVTRLVALAFATAGVTTASMTAGVPAEQLGSGCQITPDENNQALAIFSQMLPVLQHPRCSNCHGKLDVFAPSAATLHGKGVGGVQDPAEQKTFEGCQVCHSRALELVRKRWTAQTSPSDRESSLNTGRWHPASSTKWGTADPVRACVLLKRSHREGDLMLDHLREDVLVTLGFEGKRGQDNLAPEPPPISQEAFTGLMRQWMVAIHATKQWPEAGFCGCGVGWPGKTWTGYRGRSKYDITLDGGRLSIKWTTDNVPEGEFYDCKLSGNTFEVADCKWKQTGMPGGTVHLTYTAVAQGERIEGKAYDGKDYWDVDIFRER
jgi:hypothetical protein